MGRLNIDFEELEQLITVTYKVVSKLRIEQWGEVIEKQSVFFDQKEFDVSKQLIAK